MIGRWVNVPGRPLPGDQDMPRVQGAGFGASERLVVSPGHEEDGFFHMPVGQSGHPMSPTTWPATRPGRGDADAVPARQGRAHAAAGAVAAARALISWFRGMATAMPFLWSSWPCPVLPGFVTSHRLRQIPTEPCLQDLPEWPRAVAAPVPCALHAGVGLEEEVRGALALCLRAGPADLILARLLKLLAELGVELGVAWKYMFFSQQGPRSRTAL